MKTITRRIKDSTGKEILPNDTLMTPDGEFLLVLESTIDDPKAIPHPEHTLKTTYQYDYYLNLSQYTIIGRRTLI